METRSSASLILLSGLAADARVFAPQKAAFPQLHVPPWLTPTHPRESLSAYSRRLASQLTCRRPLVIGGASFGGIVAQELARVVSPDALVLIGSVRTPAELPGYVSWLRPWARALIPILPVRLSQQWLKWVSAVGLSKWLPPHLVGVMDQFLGSDPQVFRWSLRRLLDWEAPANVRCPIYQIHGDRDRTLPIHRTHPDQIVRGGGHVISLTHPTEVNEHLSQVLRAVQT